MYTTHQQRMRYLIEFRLGREDVDPLSGETKETTGDSTAIGDGEIGDDVMDEPVEDGAAAAGEEVGVSRKWVWSGS